MRPSTRRMSAGRCSFRVNRAVPLERAFGSPLRLWIGAARASLLLSDRCRSEAGADCAPADARSSSGASIRPARVGMLALPAVQSPAVQSCRLGEAGLSWALRLAELKSSQASEGG